jgi:cytochrome c peroxidase
MDNSNNTHNALPPSSDFPLFAFYCPSGSIPFFSNPVQSTNCQLLPGNPTSCDEFDTTDPGEGLADGECEDLGKMKVPVLRGLAARAPYFHGGNAANLNAVVNFYNTRFNIGLSSQQKTDLVNFLNTL